MQSKKCIREYIIQVGEVIRNKLIKKIIKKGDIVSKMFKDLKPRKVLPSEKDCLTEVSKDIKKFEYYKRINEGSSKKVMKRYKQV